MASPGIARREEERQPSAADSKLASRSQFGQGSSSTIVGRQWVEVQNGDFSSTWICKRCAVDPVFDATFRKLVLQASTFV
jgi:hypothetical protein